MLTKPCVELGLAGVKRRQVMAGGKGLRDIGHSAWLHDGTASPCRALEGGVGTRRLIQRSEQRLKKVDRHQCGGGVPDDLLRAHLRGGTHEVTDG